jgi:predicted AlkP superfamily phosphohydrolase/phosphomutase
MVIGLDCAEPSLVLERWRDRLPVLSGLVERGVAGRLTSIVPPITVPAWSCMMASRTPGDLGVYGFRNRADHTYEGAFIADGSAIKAPRLWDLVGRAGGTRSRQHETYAGAGESNRPHGPSSRQYG